MKTKKSAKFCSFVTVLAPILTMYNVGISTLTLLDATIFLTIIFIVISDFEKCSLKLSPSSKVFLILFCALCLNIVLTLLFGSFDKKILFRSFRLLLYLVWPIMIGDKYFDRNRALDYYKWLSIFATCFLIAQYVLLFGFNIILPGYVSFLPLSRPEVEEFTMAMQAVSTTRPRSIFGEPSQYGIYVSGYLFISLLKDKLKFDRKTLLLLFAGMLLSRSTTAVFGVGFSIFLIIYFILKQKKIRLTVQTMLVLVGGASTIMLVILVKIDMMVVLLRSFLLRLPASIEHRIEGYMWLVRWLLDAPIIRLLFGIGMNENAIYTGGEISWASSTIKIVVYFGLIGVVLILCMAVYLHKMSSKEIRGLIWIYLLMGFFTELLVSSWLVLFLPFLYREILPKTYKNHIKCDAKQRLEYE